MADEAKLISQSHQLWILDTLKQSPNQECSYQKLVEVGEKKHCDTVGAMLKILKNKKVLKYEQMFLMYPMHKDEIVKLVDAKFNPSEQ